MMGSRFSQAGLLAMLAIPAMAGCGGGESNSEAQTWLDTPLEPFPKKLSEVGIYPQQPDLSRVHDRAFEYSPRAPLWSNGLEKQRFLVLPQGERIATGKEEFEFPAGTVFFKTFSDDQGPVETRLLRRAHDDWEYATYQWQSEEATLLDGVRGVDVRVQTEHGSVEHTIPFTKACQECHGSSPSAVLGFQPQQLLSDRGSAQKESDLERAFRRGLLDEAPEADDALEPFDGRTREVVGYFMGNCVHCHNGGAGVASSYDLSPAAALSNVIDRPTESSASKAGIRVVPGSPEDSILFLAVSGETSDPEIKAMPPVGVQLRDPAGIELLRDWIESLE